jgi:effector-binding domain-containing protein
MITSPEVTTITEQLAATIHLVITGRDMPKYMDPAIQEILQVLADQGMRPAGPMFSYHHRRPSDTFDFEIGFPVAKTVNEAGRVQNSALPAAKVVRAVYRGPYERLGDAWRELQDWVRERKLPEDGRFFERYLNNPDEVKDPKDYRTELNWVVDEGRQR